MDIWTSIFEFLEIYGDTVLRILGFSECVEVYGKPFEIWYKNNVEVKI